MTKQQLDEVLAKYGLTIVSDQITTGTATSGFHAYDIGVGAPFDTLRKACDEIRTQWELPKSVAGDFCTVRFVAVADHPDYGKPYLRVQSFWHEEK